MVGPARRRPTAGFTFIEVMVVMAVMAVLMGLGVGYLQSIGRTSRVAQARAILRETAYACKQASNGGARAIFDLRMVDRPDGGQVLTVGAAVSQPVLTHHFESLETASLDYPLSIEGTVESEPAGYIGRAARFVGTGWIEFAPQASFAMTDGIDVDVRLKPEPGRARMMVLRGEGAYELELVRGRDTSGYEVALTLWLRDDSRGGRSPAERAPPFTTDAAPVKPGVWNHVQVRYDGHDVSLRVNDIEYATRKPRRVTVTPLEGGEPEVLPGPAAKRIAVPEGGVVKLTVSAPSPAYIGLMDSLVLGGVFRSTDRERELFGLEVVKPRLPIRVVFANGRLDPTEHAEDAVLLLKEAANPLGPRIEFRMGLYGTIESRYVTGGP